MSLCKLCYFKILVSRARLWFRLHQFLVTAYLFTFDIYFKMDTLHVVFMHYHTTHYANMSVQYTAIFHGYKNDYFQMKNCNIFLFFFAQNIDCGYTLEPSQ